MGFEIRKLTVYFSCNSNSDWPRLNFIKPIVKLHYSHICDVSKNIRQFDIHTNKISQPSIVLLINKASISFRLFSFFYTLLHGKQ